MGLNIKVKLSVQSCVCVCVCLFFFFFFFFFLPFLSRGSLDSSASGSHDGLIRGLQPSELLLAFSLVPPDGEPRRPGPAATLTHTHTHTHTLVRLRLTRVGTLNLCQNAF